MNTVHIYKENPPIFMSNPEIYMSRFRSNNTVPNIALGLGIRDIYIIYDNSSQPEVLSSYKDFELNRDYMLKYLEMLIEGWLEEHKNLVILVSRVLLKKPWDGWKTILKEIVDLLVHLNLDIRVHGITYRELGIEKE